MEMTVPLVLDLPPETLKALRLGARAAGLSPSDHARRLLADREERSDSPDALLAPLRAHFAPDFAFANGWDDLQQRLSSKGYTFRETGNDLALFSTETAGRICMMADLGCAYADLVKLYNEPFPKHFHIPVPKRAVKRAAPQTQKHPSLFPDPGPLTDWDDDDFTLFEDE